MKLLNSHTESHKHVHSKKDIISIDNLSFKYTKKSKNTISDLTMDIKRGSFSTIIGPNGSGKSTIVKTIVRSHKQQKGEIYINGEIYSSKEFSKKVSYIPQMIEIPAGITVYDFVSFGRTPYLGLFGKMSSKDKEIVKRSMEEIGVYKWKDKNTEDLSGGERQRVLVAMALAQDTEIIILDEPTTYLDIRAQYELLELLDQLHDAGKTIITILHDINQSVQYSDEIFILKDGMLYDNGSPEKVVTRKMLKEVYGVDTKLYKDNGRKYLTDVKLIDIESTKGNKKSAK